MRAFAVTTLMACTSVVNAEGLELSGISTEWSVAQAIEALEKKGYLCTPGERKDFFACNYFNPDLATYQKKASEQFPETMENAKIIFNQIIDPALSRGSVRIVSKKEVDAILFALDLFEFFLDNTQSIIGIRRPSGLDVYFTCTVSGSCDHPGREVMEAIRKKTSGDQVLEISKNIDVKTIIRQAAIASGFTKGDLLKIDTFLSRVQLTEELALCFDGASGGSICNYEGYLTYGLEPDEVASKLALEYPQAARMANEGIRIPLHIIIMESGQSRGEISFD